MTAISSSFRPAILTVIFVLSGLLTPLAAHASPQAGQDAQEALGLGKGAQCSALVAHRSAWQVLSEFLKSHGLALAAQCQGAGEPVLAQLVVLDSVKASELLRGPVADGEAVETGGRMLPLVGATSPMGGAAATSHDEWSPDVHFNRRWLTSTMKQYGFVQTSDQGWTVVSDGDLVRIALR